MAAADKPRTGVSFASREAELRLSMPESLRRVAALRPHFEVERDPLKRKELASLKKTEAQRRGETGKGSLMIKLHKPFPDLRPKHANGPLRSSFNKAWLQEQRHARMEIYKNAREEKHQNDTQCFEKSSPPMERTR